MIMYTTLPPRVASGLRIGDERAQTYTTVRAHISSEIAIVLELRDTGSYKRETANCIRDIAILHVECIANIERAGFVAQCDTAPARLLILTRCCSSQQNWIMMCSKTLMRSVRDPYRRNVQQWAVRRVISKLCQAHKNHQIDKPSRRIRYTIRHQRMLLLHSELCTIRKCAPFLGGWGRKGAYEMPRLLRTDTGYYMYMNFTTEL